MECNRRYEIFISSTCEDLKKERELLINEINKMGHIPIAMELFYAENKAPWEIIKERILSCDYYILIISDRYGSICEETKNDNSYTHEEFLLAKKLNKHILIFLRNQKRIAELPKEYKEELYRHKLKTFIQAAKTYHTAYWNDGMDLINQFQMAINKAINENPQSGWVRGISPEITKLRISLEEDKPIIYLVGADSVGKSTIALKLKNRYHLDSVVGVDVLRNGIGRFITNQKIDDEIKRLFTKSTSELGQVGIEKRSEILFDPIMAMVDRLQRKRYSAIIEGIDISPSLLFDNHRVNGKFGILLNICISDVEEHLNRYNERARNTEGKKHQSSLDKFTNDFRIRQEKLIKEIETIRNDKYFNNRLHKYYNIYNDGELCDTIKEIDSILFSLNNK